jgi:hypothetical protein
MKKLKFKGPNQSFLLLLNSENETTNTMLFIYIYIYINFFLVLLYIFFNNNLKFYFVKPIFLLLSKYPLASSEHKSIQIETNLRLENHANITSKDQIKKIKFNNQEG